VAAIACGAFSQIAARAHKAPATIFMTVSIFPLIPGAALYSMMVAIVLGNSALAAQKGAELALTCFAIVLGFMVVEVLSRYIWNTKSIAVQK
ncbi:MAG: threonine/serine exporter family protein, partial [Clostridia bacterium]|nr:threonine/serine exporter family protein [Clostridia bacterium]